MPIHTSVSRNEFHFTRSLRQGGGGDLSRGRALPNLEQNSSALFSQGGRRVPPQRRRRALVKMPNFQQIPTKRNISETRHASFSPNTPMPPRPLSRSTAGSRPTSCSAVQCKIQNWPALDPASRRTFHVDLLFHGVRFAGSLISIHSSRHAETQDGQLHRGCNLHR